MSNLKARSVCAINNILVVVDSEGRMWEGNPWNQPPNNWKLIDFSGPENIKVSKVKILKEDKKSGDFSSLFSTRTKNCLERAGIINLEQLRQLNDEDLAEIHGFGKRCIDEVFNILAAGVEEEIALEDIETEAVAEDESNIWVEAQ